MTEIRGPDYELAENDYMLGMKYKDIAEKYNVSINTVKSWKQRYNWSRKGVHTNKESVHTKLNTESKNIKPIVKEVESVLKNSELNDKQRLFCLYYSKSFNATKSYQKAYGCSYATALTEGPALKNDPRISS
ncbi:terminase small subunit, partial [Stenotrophomonas maltophilia group sp. RNC7]|uniref:terminase small subunit n=1 Tax=Stenotrophomonas maltophilia group sp. RNC7 TaxID=3071467 RepID=UPI0027E0FE9B